MSFCKILILVFFNKKRRDLLYVILEKIIYYFIKLLYLTSVYLSSVYIIIKLKTITKIIIFQPFLLFL